MGISSSLVEKLKYYSYSPYKSKTWKTMDPDHKHFKCSFCRSKLNKACSMCKHLLCIRCEKKKSDFDCDSCRSFICTKCADADPDIYALKIYIIEECTPHQQKSLHNIFDENFEKVCSGCINDFFNDLESGNKPEYERKSLIKGFNSLQKLLGHRYHPHDTPKVINIRAKELRKVSPGKSSYNSFQEWLDADSEHMYIGRNMTFYVPGTEQSKWHNPFSVKKYSLEKSLELYKEHITTSGLKHDLKELKGKTLGCWCKPNQCHGDILLEMYKKRHYKKLGRKWRQKLVE